MAIALAFSSTLQAPGLVYAQDANVEFKAKDDLAVLGKEGTLRDPDLEVLGVSRFDKAIYLGDLLTTPFGGLGRYENLLKYSEEFDNAVWTKLGAASVTANAAAAPDGTTTADQLTIGIDQIHQGPSGSTANKTYTVSVWLRAVAGTVTGTLYLWDTATSTAVASQVLTLATDWQRVDVNGTCSAAQTGARFWLEGFSGAVYAWGAQMEEASVPGVYARAVASAVAASRGLAIAGKTSLLGDVELGETLANTVKIKGTVKGSSPTLVVDQDTTADIVDFRDTGVSVFKIADGGAVTATGPLTVQGSAYLATTSGSVGIGTTSPQSKLDVADRAFFRTGPSVNQEQLLLSGNTDVVWVGASRTGANINTDLAFRVLNSGGGYEAMRIQGSSGNVGIGTTSPSEKLHVKGAIRSGNRIDIYEGTDTTRVGVLGAISDVGTGLPTVTDFVIKSMVAGGGVGIQVNNSNTVALYAKSDGNVGIGTTSPQYPLHVYGGAQIGGTAVAATTYANRATNLIFTRYDLPTSYLSKITGSWSSTTSDNTMNFELPNGGGTTNTVMTLNGAGNVGIGTTGPQGRLQVKSVAIDSNPLLVQRSGGTENILNFYEDATGNGRLIVGNSAGSAIVQLHANGDSYISTGNVGIGTTAPTAQLHTKGNLSSALTGTVSVGAGTAAVTGTGTAFATELAVGDSLKIGTEVFTVSAIASNTALTLDSNHVAGAAAGTAAYRDPTLLAVDNGDAASKLVLTRSGNVGIGTTNPALALDVAGRGRFTGDASNTIIATGNGASVSPGLVLDGTTGTGGRSYQILSTVSGAGAGAGKLAFYDGTGAAYRMVIDSSGNVAIGTTDASAAKLTVAGQVKITGGAPGANKVLTSDATGLATWTSLSGVSGVSGSGTLNYLTKWTPDGNTIGNSQIYDTGTAVGIGTTAPGQLLQVVSGAADNTFVEHKNTSTTGIAGLEAHNDLLDQATLYAYGSAVAGALSGVNKARLTELRLDGPSGALINTGAGSTKIYFALGGANPVMTIDNGNVGIGTTAPWEKLVVDGNIAITDTTYIDWRTPGGTRRGRILGDAAGLKFSSGQTPTEQMRIHAAGGISVGSSYVGTAAPSNGMIIEGNVGIGTTSPQDPLHIYNSATRLARLQSTNAAGPKIAFYNSSSQIAVLGSYSSISGSGTDMTPTIFAETGLGINFATNGGTTRNMVIDSGGNVGIGVTTPQTKLEVAGDLGTPFGGFGRYENFFQQSEALTSSPWSFATTGGTSAANATAAPDGATTAERFTAGTVGDIVYQVPAISGTYANRTFTLTVWAKAASAATLRLEANTAGTANCYPTPAASTDVTLGTTWQRYSLTGTVGALCSTGTLGWGFRLQTTGVNVNLWGAQFEEASSPGVYARTTATTVAASRGLAVAGKAIFQGDVDLGDAAANTIRLKGTVKGSSPTLVVDQDTTADIADFRDSTVSVFKIADGGAVTATGPLTVSGSAYLATTSGSVGIGTTSPATVLDVRGGTVNGQGAANNLLNLQGTSSAGLKFLTAAGTGTVVNLRAANGEGLYFDVAGADRMLINTSGNVGIGTTGPVTTLHVDASGGGVVRVSRLGTGAGVFQMEADGTDGRLTATNAMIFQPGASEKMRITSSGNVGIGTTGPNSALHVAANSGSLTLSQSGNVVGSTPKLQFATTNTAARGYIQSDAVILGDMKIQTEGGQALMLNPTSGNVGIGTTGPASKLHVSGGNLTLDNNTTFVFRTTGGANASALTLTSSDNLNLGQTNANIVGTNIYGGTGNVTVNAGAVEVARFTTGGNVGIGTTGPGAPLTVQAKSAGGNSLRILGRASDNWGYIDFRTNGDGVNTAFMGADATGLNFGSGSSGATKMILDTNGNVGIGTTGPGSRLHVLVDDAATNSVTNVLRLDHSTSGVPAAGIGTGLKFITEDSAGGMQGAGEIHGILTNVTAGSELGALLFLTKGTGGTVGERVRIDSSGNLGIGTTAPTAQLHTKGNLSSALTGTVAVTNLSTAVTGTTTAFTTELAVGDALKIGTEVFTVSAIPSATSLTLDSAYQGGTQAGLTGYRDPTLLAVDNGDAASKLILTRSGNLGIGTTAPGAKLEVAGQVKITGGAPGANKVLTSDAAGLATWTSLSGVSGVSGSGTLNYLTKWTPDGATIGNSQIYDTGTAVGIGTTVTTGASSGDVVVPNSRGVRAVNAAGNDTFQLIGFTAGNKVSIDPSGVGVGIGTTAPGAPLQVNTATSTSDAIFMGGTNSLGIRWKTTDVNTNERNWEIINNLDSQGMLSFRVGTSQQAAPSATKMAIDLNGNVGIGTTSPSDLLTIAKSGIPSLTLQRTDAVNPTGKINFYGSSGTGGGYWTIATDYSASTDFGVNYNGTRFLQILNNGNVGIGTTGPGAKLQVAGTTYLGQVGTAGDLTIYGASGVGTGTFASIGMDGTTLGQLNISAGGGSASSVNNLAISASTLPGVDNTYPLGTTSQRWNSLRVGTGDSSFAGNVGIGTTSPSQKLEVNGNIRITAGGNGTGNLPTDPTFVIGTGGKSINFLNNDAAGVNGIIGTWNTVYNTQDAKIQFNADGGGHSSFISLFTGNTATVPNEVMRLTSTGNVGIGTTAPVLPLEVYKADGGGIAITRATSTNDAALYFNTGSEGWRWSIGQRDNDATHLYFFDEQNSKNVMVLEQSTGNVGIGTTGPGAKLHVAGGDMVVDAGQKVGLEGGAGDTYMVYETASSKTWVYVNGQKIAWFKD